MRLMADVCTCAMQCMHAAVILLLGKASAVIKLRLFVVSFDAL